MGTNTSGRLDTLITTRTSDQIELQQLEYAYDNAGNITAINDLLSGETQTFVYDTLHRLTSAVVINGLANYNESYGYHAATGNLETKAGMTYTYDATHKHAVASLSNGNSYGYDANGNMVTRNVNGQSYTLNYDAENRLISVNGPNNFTAAFTYDGDGQRVKSVINGVVTTFIGTHYEVTGTNITKYYYAGTQRIAQRKNGTLNFVLGDHLGSANISTDANGVIANQTLYKAWGEERYSSGTPLTQYTYTGQYSYASDFGLHYYNARWYDSSLGRFAQADTIIPENQEVQAWDRFAYANNNPVLYNDPSGHCIWDGCVVEVLTALAIAGFTGMYLGYEARQKIDGKPSPEIGQFGDIFPDATLISHTLTISWGTEENDYLVGGVDIVQTVNEVGTCTSTSVVHGAENCQSQSCLINPPKDTLITPTVGYSKTMALLWGDDLNVDVRNYQGRASVFTGNIGPFGVEVFSSTDPNTGEPDYKVVGIGATGGVSVPFDAGLGSYYSDAEYIDWASFRKPWAIAR